MINSKGSSVVVGDEGSQRGLVCTFVVPNGDGEGEEALQYSGGDTGVGAAAVAFEIELTLEGVVDGLDDLAERFEQTGTGSRWLGLVGGTQQLHAAVVEEGLELGTGVSLVGDEELPGASLQQLGVGFQQVAGDVTFVDLGVHQRERHRQTGE